MSWKNYPIYQRVDKSFVVVMNNAPYHVPNEGMWADMHAEISEFYASEQAIKAEVEFQYIDLHPELLPKPESEPTLDEMKVRAQIRIDSATSTAILAGFEYTIDNELLHFSYDSFDQQNFADTANGALLALQNIEGIPTSVTWNGYRNHTKEQKGELVRLTLDVTKFLDLYVKGALAHKNTQMEVGGERKAIISNCTTVESIEMHMKSWYGK